MPLVLLPGLGADHRLFADLRAVYPQFEVPHWPRPQPGETLREYARRWAPAVLGQANPREPLFLGGMSFGGQVALELARYCRPAGVLLLASPAASRELLPRFRRQVRSLRWLPDRALRWGLVHAATPRLARREALPTEQRLALRAMAASADLAFFRWACAAAARWDYEPARDGSGCPVHRLHGEHDRVIPPGPGAELVPGAGHLLPMTHAPAVAAWLQRRTGVAGS